MSNSTENATLTSARLDAADPLAAYRDRFFEPADGSVISYLDGNSLGRPLRATAANLTAFVQGEWGSGLIRSWDEKWMDEPTVVGDLLGATVLGAAPGQTIIGDSTSVLLYKLLRAGLDGQAGRDEIVIDRWNFPTDRFLVEGIAAERGAKIVWIDPDAATGVTPEDVAAVIGERTALVLLSHVAYRSGFLADAPGITKLVKDAGALMMWDLCHSAGSIPTELDAWGVDLAVGCSYKYLNGGPGAPAFAYINSALTGRLQQPIWGWMGAANPFEMGADYEPAANVRRFITGTPPILAMQPLKDMLALLAEVGIEAVRSKSVALTEYTIALVREHLVPLGVELSSPLDPAHRGSHVIIDHPRFAEVTAKLWEAGVIPDFRPPYGLRIGLSPLSTSFAEVEAGILAIRGVLASMS
ncbi:kynureninase [Paeniglutamicibacter cryotolerans]|uniref:Kynureninase n=1 Tax=Paeniglutamicibacter cryotolerans TaxID=670079 RepID=A0A839QLH6_9MICC|nr:aminotransferase class V-fold PLP-dependent enzyme [Paeniglutamicibacter cryotolerans]MBB2995614.1 kynureninase [Paeniglutamicibacter cryotolerans]